MLYDLFICHASEDKESFVRPLANALRAEHIEVWYDEFTLELGDSIRRSIDKGLRQSRFGVIVLSPAFFSKRWPQYELDGLTEIEMRGQDKVLLPIWHGVGHSDVLSYSPALAGRLAISSAEGLSKVVAAMSRVVRPQGSPLVQARDVLLQWGVTPPVITDPYWLEVVEASNRVNAFGAVVPDEAAWGRWTFPLPAKQGGSRQWGDRLAWTALQLRWSQEAEERPVTPLTPPEQVRVFIESQPGLLETCRMFPDLLVEYAPQLTIPGFAGDFEALFATLYEQSVSHYDSLRKSRAEPDAAATDPKGSTLCAEEWTLRHPTFGGHSPRTVTNAYFSGGLFGPPVSPYEDHEHMVWLLSEASMWLPSRIRNVLVDGMARSKAWLWFSGSWPSAGALADAITETAEGRPLRLSRKLRQDILGRFEKSIGVLRLPETPEVLLDRFIEADLVGRLIASGF